jgi:MYXO-CTERM domain-containing protein
MNARTLLSIAPPAAVAALALSSAIQAGCALRADEVIGEDQSALYGYYGGEYGGYGDGYGYVNGSNPVPEGPSAGGGGSGSSSGSPVLPGGSVAPHAGGGGCDVSDRPASSGLVFVGVGLAFLWSLRRRRTA